MPGGWDQVEKGLESKASAIQVSAFPPVCPLLPCSEDRCGAPVYPVGSDQGACPWLRSIPEKPERGEDGRAEGYLLAPFWDT